MELSSINYKNYIYICYLSLDTCFLVLNISSSLANIPFNAYLQRINVKADRRAV